jgi:bifunctional non-homologous end joining protein LigD
MQPSLVTEVPEGDGWLHELKYDGYRTQLVITPDDVRAYTRRGHDWTDRYAEIVGEARGLRCDGAILDGEVIVQGSNGVCDFHALQQILRRKKPSGLTFMAFDLLHLDGEDLRNRPVEERRALLRNLLGPNASDRLLQFSDHVVGHGEEFFKAADAMGLEGIVSKRLGSRYRSGSAKSWVKVKAFTEGEFVAIGAAKGDLAPVALLARETEDRRLEYVGAAMVTFSERERERFWRAAEQLKVDRPPLHMEPRANTTWLRPQMRVRVRHLRGEEKLRHATLTGIAYLPKIEKPSGRPKAERSREPSIVRPELPSTGEIRAYYETVAPLMLPWVANRPLNLFRCVGSRCFFQRNRNHPETDEPFSEPIRHLPILQKNGRIEPYLYIDDAAGIEACLAAHTIEFHGWGSRVADIERPDRIALDLDPGEGVSFEDVKLAAEQVRGALDQIGLSAWPLLTGGKGMHVVIPLQPAAEWNAVRRFAKDFCTTFAEAAPERFTVKLPKEERRGRIFLDYLRNQRTATAVLPYSLRARPGCPVAAPVTWKELPLIETSDAFTLRDTDVLIKRASRMRKWGSGAQSLPAAPAAEAGAGYSS